jgi:hypothetical protein
LSFRILFSDVFFALATHNSHKRNWRGVTAACFLFFSAESSKQARRQEEEEEGGRLEAGALELAASLCRPGSTEQCTYM